MPTTARLEPSSDGPAARPPATRRPAGASGRQMVAAIPRSSALAPPRHRALVIVGTFVVQRARSDRPDHDGAVHHRRHQPQESTKGIVVAMHTVLEPVGLPFAPLPILAIIIGGLALKALVGVLVTRYVRQGRRQGHAGHAHPADPQPAWRALELLRPPVGRPAAFAIGPEADAAGQCFEVLTSLIGVGPAGGGVRHVAGLLSWQLLLIAVLVAVPADSALVRRPGPPIAAAGQGAAPGSPPARRPSSPTR